MVDEKENTKKLVGLGAALALFEAVDQNVIQSDVVVSSGNETREVQVLRWFLLLMDFVFSIFFLLIGQSLLH
jgi:hypothetical protein